MLLSSTPIDPLDLSHGVTFTALDITVRKRAEDMLRWYQLLSENTRDIILFVRSADGQILHRWFSKICQPEYLERVRECIYV